MILKIEAIIETLFNITATSITLEKNIYQKNDFFSAFVVLKFHIFIRKLGGGFPCVGTSKKGPSPS